MSQRYGSLQDNYFQANLCEIGEIKLNIKSRAVINLPDNE